MKRSRKVVYIGQIAGSMILGSLGAVVLSVAAGDGMPELSYLFMGCLFYGPFLCYPFFLTAYEGYLLKCNIRLSDISGYDAVELLKRLRACKPGDRVSLLIHPIHWRRNCPEK